MRCDIKLFSQKDYWNYAHAIHDVLLEYALTETTDAEKFMNCIETLLTQHSYKNAWSIFETVDDSRSS